MARQKHGKYIVLAILLLAIGLAVGNMWYQTRSAQRAVDYFGSAAAELIVAASTVEVLRLAPASENPVGRESLEVGGQHLLVERLVDASKAPGLLHVRRALVSDALYLWDEPPPEPDPPWHYGLRFRDGEASVTLLLDEACLWLVTPQRHERPMRVRRNEEQVSPLRAFFEEQFAAKRGLDRSSNAKRR